jgi:hypothetical protein
MAERDINVDDVRRTAHRGELIREYPDDTPFPSRLLLGLTDTGPIHVVAADDHANEQTIIITVYRPEPNQWTEDFRRKL